MSRGPRAVGQNSGKQGNVSIAPERFRILPRMVSAFAPCLVAFRASGGRDCDHLILPEQYVDFEATASERLPNVEPDAKQTSPSGRHPW